MAEAGYSVNGAANRAGFVRLDSRSHTPTPTTTYTNGDADDDFAPPRRGSKAPTASNPQSRSQSKSRVSLASTDAASGSRTLGVVGVAFVIFGSVAGGPYGIEPAVGAAGALPTLIGTLALGLLWSTTQGLVAAELSTMFPSNGGYVTWVVKGLGPVPGFVNAANSIVSAVLNLPIYPVMLAQYVANAFPGLSVGALWGVKLAIVAFTVSLNIAGIQAVSTAATALSVIVQTPFIVMPVAAVALRGRDAFNWSGSWSVVDSWQSQLSVFVSTLCWNSIGWAYVGNVASEVKNPKRSFPLGAGMAVIMTVANYFIPVLVCAAMMPDATQWDSGYFVNVGNSVAPWVGYWATFGAACSFMNNFQPQVGTTARAIRFAALYKMFPVPFMDRNWKRLNTPVPAILLQAVIIIVLMNFSFDVLVILNVLFYDVGVLLQFAAYLRLKYTAPNASRPYETPGGKRGAWIIVCMSYATLAAGFYAAGSNSWWAILIAAGCNAFFLICGLLWARFGYTPSLIDEIDAAEAHGIDASDSAAMQKAREDGLLAVAMAEEVKAPARSSIVLGSKNYSALDDEIVGMELAPESSGSSSGASLLSADFEGLREVDASVHRHAVNGSSKDFAAGFRDSSPHV